MLVNLHEEQLPSRHSLSCGQTRPFCWHFLKQWKISPIDQKAEEYWNEYSKARDDMFIRTSYSYAPWYIVNADDKKEARLNVIKHFLSNMDYAKKE